MEIRKTSGGFMRSDTDIMFSTRGQAKQWVAPNKIQVVRQPFENPKITKPNKDTQDEIITIERQQDGQEP